MMRVTFELLALARIASSGSTGARDYKFDRAACCLNFLKQVDAYVVRHTTVQAGYMLRKHPYSDLKSSPR